VAYLASTHAGSQSASAGSQSAAGGPQSAAGALVVRREPPAQTFLRKTPAIIPAAEVIVGHPRDGIVELPDVARKIPR
jgi:hypothetical protein